MTPQELLQACDNAGTRLVRFLYCDGSGLIRGKATALPGLRSRLTDGIGLTVAMMAMNSCDQLQPVAGMGPVGEIRLVPDPESFAILPYAPHAASMYCDMLTPDRAPWAACPRSFLKRMRERAAGMGYRMQAAIEVEFATAVEGEGGTFHPADTALCFSTIGMDATAPFVDDLVAALDAQGLRVEQYYPEAAKGQHEISIHHAECLRAADNHLRLRETARAVGDDHGYVISFAPKPWPEDVGNGGHIHFSLWDGAGQNAFYDPGAPDCLSDVGRQFMAGVLQHLPGLMALTCPTVNSYRRLQPRFWCSAYNVYGHDNREAAVRIASPFWSDVPGTVNLELKAADLTANPYLAFGGLLAAGLDGIRRELDPGQSLEVDPADLTDEERERRAIRRLPDSLDASLEAFQADSLLTDALGPLLTESYLAVRRSEADYYRDKSVEFEIEGHFHKW